MYGTCSASIKVTDGKTIGIIEETKYPFDESVKFTVRNSSNVSFPFYLRIPTWIDNTTIKINGETLSAVLVNCKYARIVRVWNNGDNIEINMPLKLSQSEWQANQNSRSINYGPHRFSLKSKENEKVRLCFNDTIAMLYYLILANIREIKMMLKKRVSEMFGQLSKQNKQEEVDVIKELTNHSN